MTKKKQFAMTEKASVTNHVNKHWVFTFVVGFHYYMWEESGVGDIILVGTWDCHAFGSQ